MQFFDSLKTLLLSYVRFFLVVKSFSHAHKNKVNFCKEDMCSATTAANFIANIFQSKGKMSAVFPHLNGVYQGNLNCAIIFPVHS